MSRMKKLLKWDDRLNIEGRSRILCLQPLCREESGADVHMQFLWKGSQGRGLQLLERVGGQGPCS